MGLCLPPALSEETLQGFKYFRLLGPLFDHLHLAATERDRAGNRQLFYDQYASLLLLDFFNLVVTSLRGLQQTTTLANVQERLGVRQTSLRALSDAAYVFDAALLHEVLPTLGARLRLHLPLAEPAALAPLIAADGRLLPALPRMAWALWQDDQHRAAQMHGAFAVLRQGPVDGTITAGNGSERAEWRRLGQPGGCYVVDRGDVDSSLVQALHEVPCSFRCRVKDNAAYAVQEERALSPAAVHAGVVRDAVLRRLGTTHQTRLLPQPFRVGQVATGKTRQDGTPDVVVLVTNRLDLDAELLAVASRYRWAVELFVRWVTCVLGCRHVLSQGSNGGRLQVYAACIASLLISLGVGRAPTKRTYEMLCFSLSGWATEAALIAQIDRLHLKAPPLCKN
jgi:hypothetical protein